MLDQESGRPLESPALLLAAGHRDLYPSGHPGGFDFEFHRDPLKVTL